LEPFREDAIASVRAVAVFLDRTGRKQDRLRRVVGNGVVTVTERSKFLRLARRLYRLVCCVSRESLNFIYCGRNVEFQCQRTIKERMDSKIRKEHGRLERCQGCVARSTARYNL
jgi:hypothetical protein